MKSREGTWREGLYLMSSHALEHSEHKLERWSSGLRAHIILTEDPSLVPASMLGDLKVSSTPVTREPDTSDLLRQLCVCTHMCMHK